MGMGMFWWQCGYLFEDRNVECKAPSKKEFLGFRGQQMFAQSVCLSAAWLRDSECEKGVIWHGYTPYTY